MTILLIEDGDSDAALIAAYMRETDTIYRLERAVSLESGQQRLKTRRYDAVLLDLNLPDSTGLATFELLHEAVPDLPVIVLTGLDSQELATAAVRLGAQDYVENSGKQRDSRSRRVLRDRTGARGRAAERKLRKIQEEISAVRRIQQFLEFRRSCPKSKAGILPATAVRQRSSAATSSTSFRLAKISLVW